MSRRDFERGPWVALVPVLAWAFTGAVVVVVTIVLIGVAIDRARSAPTHPDAVQVADSPWPECPRVVAFLKKNVDDPSGLEVVEWVRRNDEPQWGFVDVVVRYRCKNKAGAFQVFRNALRVWPDRIDVVS